MARPYKSKATEALHEAMRDLHSVGAIDAGRMREFDQMCLRPDEVRGVFLTFELFRDPDKLWRWRLTDTGGQVIAASGEGYRVKKDCLAAIRLVRSAAYAKVAA
jgi:uncharacterized protein YegP (UPF0339 family)